MHSSNENPFDRLFLPSSDHQALVLQRTPAPSSAKRSQRPFAQVLSPKRARSSIYTPSFSPKQIDGHRSELQRLATQMAAQHAVYDAWILHLESQRSATVIVDVTTNRRGLIQALAHLQKIGAFCRQLQQLPLSAMYSSLRVWEDKVSILEQNFAALQTECIQIEQQFVLIKNKHLGLVGKLDAQSRTISLQTDRISSLMEILEGIGELPSHLPHQTCPPGSPSSSSSASSLYLN